MGSAVLGMVWGELEKCRLIGGPLSGIWEYYGPEGIRLEEFGDVIVSVTLPFSEPHPPLVVMSLH